VGIRTVILPRHNERDVEDVPVEVRGTLRFIFVDDAGEVVRQALSDAPDGAAAR
jgi:ATP-dependent Lon protease